MDDSDPSDQFMRQALCLPGAGDAYAAQALKEGHSKSQINDFFSYFRLSPPFA